MKEKIVLSLGGSIVAPDGVDVAFLKRLRTLLLKQKDKQFYIIVGGGKTCRNYQSAARKIGRVALTDLDWIGISASRLNAELVRSILAPKTPEQIFLEPQEALKFKAPIIVGGGWKPGWSTDYVSVVVAKLVGANQVVNLSNIDYLCDKDPGKFKDAKKLAKIDWKQMKKIVGTKWQPGMNVPFDPVASQLAAKAKMKLFILNGRNIHNLGRFLAGKIFVGTTISA